MTQTGEKGTGFGVRVFREGFADEKKLAGGGGGRP